MNSVWGMFIYLSLCLILVLIFQRSSNRYSEFGPVLHPLSKPGPDARLAGGSSGGSAAAVALNECDL